MTSSFLPLLLITLFLHHFSLCLKVSLLSSSPSLPFALLPQALLLFPFFSSPSSIHLAWGYYSFPSSPRSLPNCAMGTGLRPRRHIQQIPLNKQTHKQTLLVDVHNYPTKKQYQSLISLA